MKPRMAGHFQGGATERFSRHLAPALKSVPGTFASSAPPDVGVPNTATRRSPSHANNEQTDRQRGSDAPL
jgi:hypothetical protein